MSRSLSPAHLDEATLLRLVAADLDAAERAAAELHLGRCAACRRERSRTEMLDGAMRELAANAAKPAVPFAVIPSDDPFCRRPEASLRLAKDAGVNVRALAAAAAEASGPATARKSSLLEAAKGERAGVESALASLHLDRLADRLALSGALSEAFDRVEDDPRTWRRFGEAALERISKEPAVEGLNEMRPKPQEYAAPLTGLSAAAQLLVAAGDLLHAEFDGARVRLEAAWRSLEGGRDALPLVARLETIASILRTIAGRPAEGLALAERAAETFAVTGHPVDAARAEFAKGLSELGAGNTREGNVALRRARGTFARAGAWRAFAISVTALAVAETGPADGPELKGLFRASLGRLRRSGAVDSLKFLRASHRVILLTRRLPRRGVGRETAKNAAEPIYFEPSLPYRLRGGDLLAEGIVRAAREGDEELRQSVRSLEGLAARGFALLYVCQEGSSLVGENPHRTLALGELVFEEAETLTDANLKTKAAMVAFRRTVQAEARLLESNAHAQLTRFEASLRAARDARRRFNATGAGRFGESLAVYFEGQALGFLKRYRPARSMLQQALESFTAYGQGHLSDRAFAAVGTLMTLMGDLNDAHRTILQAIRRFEEDSDARTLATLHCNLGSCLMKLRRYDEARIQLVRALAITRRRALQPIAHIVRNNLAELEMRRGRLAKAVENFMQLQLEALSVGSEQHYVWATLFIAECQGRRGCLHEMASTLVTLRERLRTSRFSPSQEFRQLLRFVDRGSLKFESICALREYLEAGGFFEERRTARLS